MKRIGLAGFLLAAMAFAVIRAQSPAPAHSLSPEASRKFIEIGQTYNRTFNECSAVLKARADEQMALLIGAGVPLEMRANCEAKDGIVTCSKPKAGDK